MSKANTHPMRPFTGADGTIYQRRADITMREWRAYTKDDYTTQDVEAYWVGLFLGMIDPATMVQSQEERAALAETTLGEMVVEEYMAIRMTIFNDILNPASPEKNEQAQPITTMTDEVKETVG